MIIKCNHLKHQRTKHSKTTVTDIFNINQREREYKVYHATDLKHPLQVFEVVRIDSFNVMISHFNPKDMLVKGSCEMNIKKLTIKKRFSDLCNR